MDLEISELPAKKSKTEQREYDISWEQQAGLAEADSFSRVKEERIECDVSLEQQPAVAEIDKFTMPEYVKNELDEESAEDINAPHISDTFKIRVVDVAPESSATVSADEGGDEVDDVETEDSEKESSSADDSEADHQGEEWTVEHHRLQNSKTSKSNVSLSSSI